MTDGATVLPVALDGRAAVVTGASSGIGRATAELLSQAGARVLCIDSKPFEPRMRSNTVGDGVVVRQLDVRDHREQSAAITDFAEATGGLEVLVTSAGVYGSGLPLDELSPDDIEQVIGVNLLGTIWSVRAALPALRAGRGSMVLVGSIAGHMGGVLAGGHYAASKGGVHSLVRSLARRELTHGVRVNGVVPGPIATPMVSDRGYDERAFPIGRWGEPEEVARAIVFLASPLSSYITGVLLDVNGGLSFH